MSSLAQPPFGAKIKFGDIPWHAPALAVNDPQVRLRFGVPLGGRLSKPHRGLFVALGHSLALEVHVSQILLRVHMPLVGFFSIPHRGLFVTPEHPSALIVYYAQVSLHFDVPLVGRLSVPHRGLIVAPSGEPLGPGRILCPGYTAL